MTVLYDYWRSSASYRVRIALLQLGLPYDTIGVDLVKGEQTGAENLARNPQGLVPSLDIDGAMLTQSLAIIEYLDETRAGGFLPADPLARARVRALAYAIAMDIHPICNLRVARRAVELSQASVSMQTWMTPIIAEGLAAFEVMLDHPETGPFCHGDQLSLADICLVPQVYNAHRWGVDVSAMPRICAVVAQLERLPAVQAAHPDNWVR